MKNNYQIHVWCKHPIRNDQEKPDHVFLTSGNRGVVGIMKTIMDNFQPQYVEVNLLQSGNQGGN